MSNGTARANDLILIIWWCISQLNCFLATGQPAAASSSSFFSHYSLGIPGERSYAAAAVRNSIRHTIYRGVKDCNSAAPLLMVIMTTTRTDESWWWGSIPGDEDCSSMTLSTAARDGIQRGMKKRWQFHHAAQRVAQFVAHLSATIISLPGEHGATATK